MLLPNGTTANTARPSNCEVHGLARVEVRKHGTKMYRCPRCLEMRRKNSALRPADDWEERDDRQRRLLASQQKLESVGIDLDELIELIEARQSGSY